MTTTLAIFAGVINILLLGFITRRLLGVPIGWPRTILASAIVFSAQGALMRLVVIELGYLRPDGTFAPDVHPAISASIMLLVGAWTVALGVGALVIAEALVPTGTLPRPLTVLRDLPARRRRARRYAQIVGIATKHGLGGFLRPTRHRLGEDAPRVARSLRQALTDGGVTFIKLGQMLSTRPDLVGVQFATELGGLTTDVEPQGWATIEATLAAEWGAPPAQVLAHIDRVPLAAASVGQVHRAQLHDGTAAVIKVQRSDARTQVSADVDILRRLSTWLERTTDWGKALRVRSLVEGFADSLDEELDYRVEADNARTIATAAGTPADDDEAPIEVPRVYQQWSGARVLVMTELDGRPLSRAKDLTDGLPAADRTALAHSLLRVVLRQVLQVGVFHADLHPGNVYLTAEGTLGLLDFGSVGRLDRGSQEALGRLVFAVDRADSAAAADALLEVLDRPAHLDERTLERELGVVVVRYRGGSGATGSGGMFTDLFALVIRHGFGVPPQIAAAFRAFGALEGTLRLLDPQLDLLGAAREAGRDLIADRVKPAQLKFTLQEQIAQTLPILQRLPRRIDALTDAAQRGELSLNLRLLSHPDDRSFITGLLQQLTITLIAGAAAIGAILLVISDTGPVISEGLRLYPLLGAGLFLVAFILAARALALAFRHNARTHWGARE